MSMFISYVTNIMAEKPANCVHIIGLFHDHVTGIKEAFEWVCAYKWVKSPDPNEKKYHKKINKENDPKKLLKLVNKFCNKFRKDSLYHAHICVDPIKIMDKLPLPAKKK